LPNWPSICLRSPGMAEPLVLFHLSDLHFGLEDRKALAWVESCIADEKPAAVAITGDLTMRARRREFHAATDWITAIGRPVTVEVGNHDLPYFNLVERFTDPYRRFRGMERLVEREIALPGIALIPLKTTARAQWRFPWSNGWITGTALRETLAAIDALPAGTRAIVTAHHPLTERRQDGKLLTRGGNEALGELAKRGVLAVLSGHVHDAFDMMADTAHGPLRMIGAGTLSRRIRSTPPSFNQITLSGAMIDVKVRNLADVPSAAMMIDDVPENALPPRKPEEPVAPVAMVPPVDPPVH
jgi:3',5'-cyclic AMP phosphodiesterase CpdA